MSRLPTPVEIARDARWLAQALDPASDQLRLVEMNAEAYRSASFLDDRIFQQPCNAVIAPWSAVASAISPDARRDARWLFHIGHVGSTLIARLIGELPNVLAIREPRILRDLVALDKERRSTYIGPLQALLSRGFQPDDVALVKATSFVSELAPELVPSEGRALLIHASPRAYIAGILAGENSRKELAALAESRRQRMFGRVRQIDDERRSEAHLAAAAWACEMTSLEQAAAALGDRAAWLDFDVMLGDVTGTLERACAHLRIPATAADLSAIAAGPIMRRYSKAPEFEYSPQLRRELLAEVERFDGPTIDSALAMLHRAAKGSSLLKLALSRSANGN